MLGNFEIEIQTARHIANNRSDRSQRFFVLCMLASALSALFIFMFTPLGLLRAIVFGISLVAIVAIPLRMLGVRRRAVEAAELEQLQTEQLKDHRANQTDCY